MLEKVKPREQAGRDVFARYKAQVRSAAIAALAILEGEIDRVYCDLHDDFVIRYKLDEGYQYSFFQVKTNNKSNSNWTINDLFGISSSGKKTADLKKMQDSFAGKMFLHTVNFPNSCAEVIFQTNITINDAAEKFVEDVVSGNFSAKNTQILFKMFHEVVGDADKLLSPEDIVNCLSKFRVATDVQYIKSKEHRFDSYAVEHIFKYSEIELTRAENELILLKLVDLVSNKSSGIIADYNETTIESEAAISIDDLLKVLSISKSAYELLAQNGDEKAIKNASMIQRALKGSGADSELLTYCAKCKVSWDIWKRNNRHCLSEYQILDLCSRVNGVLKKVIKINSVDFSVMITNLEDLKKDLELNDLLFDLNMDELIGAFFSELSKEQI